MAFGIHTVGYVILVVLLVYLGPLFLVPPVYVIAAGIVVLAVCLVTGIRNIQQT